jgi:hypothetical protein
VYFFFNIAISKEKKAEDGETSVTLRMSSSPKSTLNRLLKKLNQNLLQLREKSKRPSSKSQRNLKLLLLKSTTRTRVLRSITPLRRRSQKKLTSMLNGSKRKN